jgi:Type II/IV secretion system protein
VVSLLKAWNTGHPGGVCTVHANHARAGLRRIEQLIAEVSQTPMRALIAEVANLIVSIEPPTPTLAANSCNRSEQQVMMVAVPRNQLELLFCRKTSRTGPTAPMLPEPPLRRMSILPVGGVGVRADKPPETVVHGFRAAREIRKMAVDQRKLSVSLVRAHPLPGKTVERRD